MVTTRVTQVGFLLCLAGACFADGARPKPEPLPAGVPATTASLYRLAYESGRNFTYREFARTVANFRVLREPEEVVEACRRLGLEAEHREADWGDLAALKEPFLARELGGNWLLYRAKEGKLRRLERDDQAETPVSEAEFLRQWSRDIIVLAKSPPVAVGGQPQMRFAHTSHDFGPVWEGEKAEHRFPFENVGSATLEIVNVVAKCGCTEVRIEKATAGEGATSEMADWGEKIFAPGESGIANFVFDSKRRRGSTESSATITTNEPGKNTHRLSVKANVRNPVEVRPSGLHFGRVAEGSSATREIRVWSDYDPAFEVLEATTASASVGVEYRKLGPEGEQKKSPTYLLAVSLDVGDATIGQSIQDRIVLRTTSAQRPVIEVTVSALVSHEVYLSPETLNFGMLPPNGEIGRPVNILNIGQGELKILDVRSDIPNLVIQKNTVREGKQYQILATLQTGENPEPVTGEVVITTNHSKRKEIRVPVTSSVQAAR